MEVCITRYIDMSGKKKVVVFQKDRSGATVIGKFEVTREFTVDSYEPTLKEIPFVPTNRKADE